MKTHAPQLQDFKINAGHRPPPPSIGPGLMRACPHVDAWRLAPAARRGAFRRIVCDGIPASVRAELWRVWTGADESAAASAAPGGACRTYAQLASGGADGLPDADARLLRADVPRTPCTPPASHAAVERVLVALVHARAPADGGGYSQGLNFLCSFMLAVVGEEEAAFWALLRLSERVGLFAHDLVPLHLELALLDALARARWPHACARLDTLGLPIGAVAARWLLLCGHGTLAPAQCIRLWDCILYEEWVEPGGGGAVMLATALTLFGARAMWLVCARSCTEAAELLSTAEEGFGGGGGGAEGRAGADDAAGTSDECALVRALYPAPGTVPDAAARANAHPAPLTSASACACAPASRQLGGGGGGGSPGTHGCAPLCPHALARARQELARERRERGIAGQATMPPSPQLTRARSRRRADSEPPTPRAELACTRSASFSAAGAPGGGKENRPQRARGAAAARPNLGLGLRLGARCGPGGRGGDAATAVLRRAPTQLEAGHPAASERLEEETCASLSGVDSLAACLLEAYISGPAPERLQQGTAGSGGPLQPASCTVRASGGSAGIVRDGPVASTAVAAVTGGSGEARRGDAAVGCSAPPSAMGAGVGVAAAFAALPLPAEAAVTSPYRCIR